MESKIPWSKLLLLFILLTVSVYATKRKAGFGEYCDRLNRCDSKSSLHCVNGTCQCLMPETMTLEPFSGVCVTLSGEKCIFTTVAPEGERMWTEQVPCVPNADCIDGYCSCQSEFFETEKGICADKREYGEECDSDSICKKDLHLICSEGHCLCNSSTSSYDETLDRCLIKAGLSCGTPDGKPSSLCVINSKCGSDSHCICYSGYFPTSSGTCEPKRGYGNQCDHNENCKEKLGLFCRDEKCQCDINSLYDDTKETCVNLASKQCTGTETCVTFSKCLHGDTEYNPYYVQQYNWEFTCNCQKGYFNTTEGTCEPKRSHGQECQADNNCRNEDNYELICASGRCLCEAHSLYDYVAGKCLRKVGEDRCKYYKNYDNVFLKCVPNAQCQYSGACTCSQGFDPDALGRCVVSVNGKCNDLGTRPCDDEAGLTCQDGICSCEYLNHQYFDLMCKSYVQGPCGNDSFVCTPNAECISGTSRRQECLCKEGFLPVNRKCEIAYGQPCSNENLNPTCDQLGKLHCIEGKCQCGKFRMYDEDKLKCVGLVGSICDTESDDFCIIGAICERFRSSNPKQGRCVCKPGYGVTFEQKCTLLETTTTIIIPFPTVSHQEYDAENALMQKDDTRV